MTKEEQQILRLRTLVRKIKDVLKDHDVDTDPWSDSLEEIEILVTAEKSI